MVAPGARKGRTDGPDKPDDPDGGGDEADGASDETPDAAGGEAPDKPNKEDGPDEHDGAQRPHGADGPEGADDETPEGQSEESPEGAGGSLSKRLREAMLREAAESDAAVVERAAREKAGLRRRMEAAAGGQASEPEIATLLGRTLSQRLRDAALAGPSAAPATTPDVAASAGGGAPPHTSGGPAAPATAPAARAGARRPMPPPAPRTRAVRWLLGQQAQDAGDGVITAIPALDSATWEEVEFTPIEPPYSFVRIRRHRRTQELFYEVIEPQMSRDEKRVLAFVEDALVRGLTVDPGTLHPDERLDYLLASVRRILRDYQVRIDATSQARLEYYLRRDFLGLGAIHVPMVDSGIEDISCDGAEQPLFIFHRQHESVASNLHFADAAELDAFVIKLAQRSGKAISISDPILDAALPDGSRLQATLGQEVTQNGSTFTIRRFRPDPFTPIDLVRFGTMDADMLAYFWLLVQHGQSLIFSGGTASGKTTGLNAICQFIPHQAKIVSIEDTREVNLPHRNWIKAVTRAGSTHAGSGEIGMFELLKAALRQRPEYILVGEVRGVEATVAFQAMATGHTVYSTMHADSARSVVYRLENEPISIPRLVLQALDVIAIQAQVRFQGKRVRRVKEVVELVGLDPVTRELLTNTVFRWRADDDTFERGFRSYLLERIAEGRGWTQEDLRMQMEERKEVIRWLVGQPPVRVQTLGLLVRTFARDAQAVLAVARAGGSVQDLRLEAEAGHA